MSNFFPMAFTSVAFFYLGVILLFCVYGAWITHKFFEILTSVDKIALVIFFLLACSCFYISYSYLPVTLVFTR